MIKRETEPRNQNAFRALHPPDFPRAALRQRGGYAMWVQLFSIVFTIALGLGLSAVVLEAQEEAKPVRNFRHR
jgi:hypothetical protein